MWLTSFRKNRDFENILFNIKQTLLSRDQPLWTEICNSHQTGGATDSIHRKSVCLVKTAVSHESPPRCGAGGPAWAAAIPSGCVAAGSETERGEEKHCCGDSQDWAQSL